MLAPKPKDMAAPANDDAPAQAPGDAAHVPPKRASEVLRAAAMGSDSEFITIREIVDAFGERAFGFVIILFSLPNCVPAPPGVLSIFGVPVLLFAIQMALGRKKPWLPRRILDKSFRRADLIGILDKAAPKLAYVERMLKPRAVWLFSPVMERVFGVFVALLSLSVILPFPGTNYLPAFATVFLSMALIEEDGVVLGMGAALGLAGLVLTTFIISAFAGVIYLGLKALLGI
jgi:hypothetical protein